MTEQNLNVLEGVSLGINTEQLRALADAERWQHNVPQEPQPVMFVSIHRPGQTAKRLFCTVREDVVVSIEATFEPAQPLEVQRFLSRYHNWNDISEVGLQGGISEDQRFAAYATVTGDSLTLVDLAHERPDDAERLRKLLGP